MGTYSVGALLTKHIAVSHYLRLLPFHFPDNEMEAQGGSDLLKVTAQINMVLGFDSRLDFKACIPLPTSVPQFPHLHCEGLEEMTSDLANVCEFEECFTLELEPDDPRVPLGPDSEPGL